MKRDPYHVCDESSRGFADECSKDGQKTYFFTSSPMDGDFDVVEGDPCRCNCHQAIQENDSNSRNDG